MLLAVVGLVVGALLAGGLPGRGTPAPTGALPTAQATAAPTGDPALSATPAPTPGSPSPTVARLPVTVLNATTRAGLATSTAEVLRRAGWTVSEVGNLRGRPVTRTTVFYGPGQESAARALAAAFPQVAAVAARPTWLTGGGSLVLVVVTWR